MALTGRYSNVEPLRLPLTAFLQDQKFQHLYVLKDEISEHIAVQLYPHLYRIENRLRGYLIKFMSTRIGPTWWKMTVSREMDEKVSKRKKNEKTFSKHVDNSAYLIDFDELGEIVYEQTCGFVTKEDILKKINALQETPEALKAFKKDLQNNYQKLFKESFADEDFKSSWQQFEILRNKIAHGNLFTAKDLAEGEELAGTISDLIDAADLKTDKFVITEREREAIQESVESEPAYSWQMRVVEEDFLCELERSEARFPFVGLSLLKRHLTNLGYSYQSVTDMIESLKARGKVEIHYVKNPGSDFDTAAIRLPRGTLTVCDEEQ